MLLDLFAAWHSAGAPKLMWTNVHLVRVVVVCGRPIWWYNHFIFFSNVLHKTDITTITRVLHTYIILRHIFATEFTCLYHTNVNNYVTAWIWQITSNRMEIKSIYKAFRYWRNYPRTVFVAYCVTGCSNETVEFIAGCICRWWFGNWVYRRTGTARSRPPPGLSSSLWPRYVHNQAPPHPVYMEIKLSCFSRWPHLEHAIILHL